MRREIKFRGYNDKKQWLYGDLLRVHGIPYIINSSINPFCLISPDVIDDIRVDPNTIGQFTGLHDCEGKEIYEGDIISDGEFSHIVSYSLNDARFVVILIEHFTDEIERVMNMSCVYQEWLTEYDKKVIGNIHNNPELIERESNH